MLLSGRKVSLFVCRYQMCHCEVSSDHLSLELLISFSLYDTSFSKTVIVLYSVTAMYFHHVKIGRVSIYTVVDGIALASAPSL